MLFFLLWEFLLRVDFHSPYKDQKDLLYLFHNIYVDKLILLVVIKENGFSLLDFVLHKKEIVKNKTTADIFDFHTNNETGSISSLLLLSSLCYYNSEKLNFSIHWPTHQASIFILWPTPQVKNQTNISISLGALLISVSLLLHQNSIFFFFYLDIQHYRNGCWILHKVDSDQNRRHENI